MKEPTVRYSNGEINVVWKPERCMHSGICVRGLPAVFNVARKPWVKMDEATTEEIRAQVELCPSGALSWEPAKDK